MKLSIVIVNYNVKHFLEQALQSVFRSKFDAKMEVFVVDNASIDGSVEMVKERFPEVLLTESKDNLGFSKGNNLAIRKAKGQYVLLLNPDTIVREDTLQQVVDFMDQHPDAGALGVKMIDGKGQFLPESKRGFPSPQVAFFKMSGLSTLFPKSKLFGKYHLGYLSKEEIHEVEVLSGAFMLLRKDALDKVGLLDEDFFMYGEDIDLSHRIIKGGYKNYYYPHAPIIHFKGESTKKGSLNYVKVFYQAMIIFAKKHISGGAEGIYIFLLQMAIYLRAAIALFSRLWSKIGWPLVDATVLLATLSSAHWLWENVIRVNDGLKFNQEIWLINFPIYLISWTLSLYLSGSYDKQAKLFNIAGGMVAGTVIIGALYGFFPNGWRSSRGIILYGFSVGLLSISLLRYLYSLLKGNPKHLFIDDRKMVIVGSVEEAKRVHGLLKDMAAKREYLGFVTPNLHEIGHPECLGTLDKLQEILPFIQTEEIIFCAKDISPSNIIARLAEIGGDIDFKIAAEEGTAIIGSSSKNDTGELLTYDVGFKITKSYLKRLKRFIDILLGVIFLLLSPILFVIQKRKLSFISNCIGVISGKLTWISYCKQCDIHQLPKLKNGILCPADNIVTPRESVSPALISRLNYLYARDYSPITDLQIIFNSLNLLGGE